MNAGMAILYEGLQSGLPVLVLALGALGTEYAGVLNVGIEGLAALGGFLFTIVAASVPGPAGAVLAVAVSLSVTSAAAGAADYFARHTRSDPFVVGLALNLLLPAAVMSFSERFFATKGVINLRPAVEAFSAAGGAWLLGGLALAFLVGLYGFTPFALRTKALGMRRESLELAGLAPGRIRTLNYCVSGFGAAVAGVLFVLNVSAWVPSSSAGRGWLALVMVYLGGKTVRGTMLATLLFALLGALAARSQGLIAAPPELVSAIPFALAFIVVVFRGIRGKRTPTATLG